MKTSITILIMFCLCLLNGCKGKSSKSGEKPDSLQRITGTVSINETELNYFIEGEGYPCIVVTEGELISHAMSKELKKQFKFIFMNARMNIANPGEIDKITFNLLTEDVDLVRKTLNLEKVGVFGHSVAGLIALEYARNYPQHTNFVIMNGTPPYVNERYNDINKTYWEANASEERKKALTERWKGISRDSLNKVGSSDAGKLVYILNSPRGFFDYKFEPTILLKDTYWNMGVLNHIFGNLMVTYDLKQDKPIEAPVFLSLGKQDYMVPFIMWDDQKEKIPTLSLNLFEKSGHYPFFEEEKLFRSKVIDWLEKLKIKN